MAKRGEKEQRDMAKALDRLKRFEAFEALIAPVLRKDLSGDMSADEIYDRYEAIVAARAVTIALTELDSGKAMSAIKDVRDRKSGKATEKREVTHKLEKLREEELDALLLTEMSDLDGKDS